MSQLTAKPEYMDPIRLSFLQQLPCLVICSLLLDGGRTLRVCLIAMLGFWLLAMLCLVRSQRERDLFGPLFLRWGFIPLLIILFRVNEQFHPIVGR